MTTSRKVEAIRAAAREQRLAQETPGTPERAVAERARRPIDKIRAAIDMADAATLRAALAAVVDVCTFPDGLPSPMRGDVLDAVGVALGTRKART